MRHGFWFEGLWLLALLVGCGSNSEVKPNPGGSSGSSAAAGGSSGSSGGSPASDCKFTGAVCDCASGLRGTYTCVDNQEICDCAECMSRIPTPPPDVFDACGGEPFGAWRLVGTEYAAMPYVLKHERLVLGECLADVTEGAPQQLLLELADGGDARIDARGGLLRMRFPGSCILQGLNESCSEHGCTSDDCTFCTCEQSFIELAPRSADWVRTGSQLSIYGETGSPLHFDYCIKNDELTLRVVNTQTLLKLERVSLGSKPVECSQRTPDTCAKQPELSQDTCHVGACTGEQKCLTAMTEANCTNQQGCSWDTTQCAGVAALDCGIRDYGLVPGCEVTTEK